MKKIVFLVAIALCVSQAAIYQATDGAGSVILTTSAIKVEVKKSPFQIIVSDLAGKVITSQAAGSMGVGAVTAHASAGTTPVVKRSKARYHAEDEAVITGESHKFTCGSGTVYITFRNPHVFSMFSNKPGANADTKESFVSSSDEHFWGLGETWDVHSLDLKGKKLTMANRSGTPDQGGYIPFYISSRGYGILVDNYRKVSFDFSGNSTNISIPAIAGSEDGENYIAGASTNWYFYYGPNMLDVIDRYTEHVSRPALPPPWAVFSTWQWRDANTEAGARSDVKGMQDAGIPLSLIWLDRPWATGGQGMPPPFKWNGDFPNGAQMTKDLNAKGVKVGVWVAENGYVGAYNAKSYMKESDVNKLKGDITSWLGQSNVQMYKIDRGNLQNFAPYFSIQAFYEAWYSVFEDDFVTLPRVVSHRGQKYISGKWPGDNDNAYGYDRGGLASNIPAMLNFGIAGFPNWGSDTGGFPDVPGNDITIRWAQFSSMSVIFQTCSKPHTYSATNKAIYKKYAMLYTSLFPYRWTYVVNSHKTGHPTFRALALHHPDDPKGYNQDAELYFGDWILAAPIVEKVTSRSVYLPEGEWIDWWTGERHAGKTSINVNAPLDVMPMFMKAGAIIPMIEVTDSKNQTWLNCQLNPLVVRVCPAGNTSFVMAGDKKVYKKQTKPYTNLDPVTFNSKEVTNGVVISADGAATTQYQFEVYSKKVFLSATNNGVPLTKVASASALASATSGWVQEAGKPAIVKVPAGAKVNQVGLSTTTGPVSTNFTPGNMKEFRLLSNTFTNKLDVSFSLSTATPVSMKIYQADGHLIKTLLSRSFDAGNHTMSLSSEDLAPGNYLVSIKAGQETQKNKFVILK